MKHVVARYLGLLAVPAPILAQICGPNSLPTYVNLVSALQVPGLRVDTLPIAGNREFTVVLEESGRARPTVLGRPTERSAASALASCRVAALWTSRGDSVAVNWLLAPAVNELATIDYTGQSWSRADQPRPSAYTGAARLRFREVMRSFIAAARERAAGDYGRGYTNVYVLIDSIGRPEITRILVSSGRRTLDEAALSGPMLLAPGMPSDSVGTGVSRWYVVPISWTGTAPGLGRVGP